MTTIISNGSKWGGSSPDSIDELLDVLHNEPLDRTFERYGNFIYRLDDPEHGYESAEARAGAAGSVRFFGNFYRLSHVFTINSDEPETIAALTTAIRANQQRADYLSQSPIKHPAKVA